MSVSGKVDPVVRRISATDIAEALSEGLRDFQALPLYGLAFGALYAGGGIAILLCLTAFGMVYLAYPLAAGFAMLGPFVAIGLYEVSRRREAGQPVSVAAIWTTISAAQPIIGSGLVTTARTLVIIAVTKSTSRSSSSGNDTTVSENKISDSAAPTALPIARNSRPSLVVSTTVVNS